MGPHMRNYIQMSYGTVTYSQINPTPPPATYNQTVQHFVTGDEEATTSQMDEFTRLLDPAFFVVDGRTEPVDIFWLLNKDILIEVFQIATGWWGFIGTNVVVTESPRKSWSHGH